MKTALNQTISLFVKKRVTRELVTTTSAIKHTSLKRRTRKDKASIQPGHFTVATEPVTPDRICLVVNLAVLVSLSLALLKIFI